MFGIIAIIVFAVGAIIQGAGLHGGGAVLRPIEFVLVGLAFLAVHVVTGWWPRRGPVA